MLPIKESATRTPPPPTRSATAPATHATNTSTPTANAAAGASTSAAAGASTPAIPRRDGRVPPPPPPPGWLGSYQHPPNSFPGQPPQPTTPPPVAGMLVNDTYTQYRPTAYTPCPNQPAFLVNGVVHNLVMQDYNGLPYVFALPQMNGAAFGAAFGAAPPPFFVNNVASSASGHYLVHPATSPQDVQHAYNATSHALAAAAAAAAYGMPPIPGALDPSMAQTPFTAGAAAATSSSLGWTGARSQ